MIEMLLKRQVSKAFSKHMLRFPPIRLILKFGYLYLILCHYLPKEGHGIMLLPPLLKRAFKSSFSMLTKMLKKPKLHPLQI